MFRHSLLAVPSALTVALLAGSALAQGAGGAAGESGQGGNGAAEPMCESGVLSLSGSLSQLGRVFRDAVPSSCPGKAYPGIFNATASLFYETFVYTNAAPSAVCVTAHFDPNVGDTPCGVNAHASAYAGSYDPNDQASNFVGDVGASIADDFSFEVPATTDLFLVVSNTSTEQICNFSLDVEALPCIECGNGAVEFEEECDDSGNSLACNADCTFAACGDLHVNPAAGEDCDEGVESVTCDLDCTLPECGDGHTNDAAGETCDDGADSAACDSDCTVAECGDGYTNDAAAEQCDDGGTADGDGCSALCVVETPAGAGGAGGAAGADGSEGGAAGDDGSTGVGGSNTSGASGSNGATTSGTTTSGTTTGGSPGSGGSTNPTSGGSEAGSAGLGGGTGGASDDGAANDAGCSCRLDGTRSQNSGIFAGLALALAAAFRRRRSSRAV
jgi:MYXO-CTERM domain-containing protein